MTDTTSEKSTDETVEQARESLNNYNDERKRDKLRRQATRAHEWRVQVWAQSELKIRAANAALVALGSEPVEQFDPQFNDDEMLHHYSSMQLSK